jgi:hypothetical protein
MTDMINKEGLFIEEILLNSVKKLLLGRVNEILREMEYPIPAIEFGTYRGGSTVVPVIALSTCERSEKERIVRLDAYTLTITFELPETPESELHCYGYSGAVSMAFYDDPTLGGVVDRAVITGKKYAPPKCAGTGENWEVVLSLRLTLEGIGI